MNKKDKYDPLANGPMLDSPVEQARKAGPLGDGNWTAFDPVYTQIQPGCHKMAQNRNVHLSQDHVDSMADLASGHKERMKARLHWMYTYNWI
jgi:hypothetical protein